MKSNKTLGGEAGGRFGLSGPGFRADPLSHILGQVKGLRFRV